MPREPRDLEVVGVMNKSFENEDKSDRLLAYRYQFNTELYNPDVVINILIKALTASPLPDFNLCVSLLDERPINATLDEPDPLPTLLPVLRGLHDLLFRCRFPAFWDIYRSDDLESLRDNYTVEVAGFDNAVRKVVIRAVQAAFTRISTSRLGSYLALTGTLLNENFGLLFHQLISLAGDELTEYVTKLGWTTDPTTSVVSVPPNLDNQIQATVVQESINLPRTNTHNI